MMICQHTIGGFKSYVDALNGLYPQLLYSIDFGYVVGTG